MKSKINVERIIKICLVLLNGFFIAYWGMLAYYSQLHYDDLHFLWKMREMSVFEYVKQMYFTRSGRLVGYAINGVVSIITDKLGFHQLWVLFYYVLGIGICWLVVKDVKLPISRFGLFMGVCFLYNLYILTNIDFPVFFWLCAMAYYLFFPLTCLLLKYLNEEKLNWWQWLIVVLLLLLIGGGNEAFTPIVLLLMFINGMYYWHSKAWIVKNTWALPQVKRIVWGAGIMLVLFSIVVVAPGNYNRMEDASQFVHPLGVIEWLKAMTNAVGMFLYFMAFYLPYYLVVFVLSFYIGSKSDVQLPVKKRKLVFIFGVGFVAYLLVSSLPNVYLYNGFGIQRTYTPAVFVLMLVVVSMGFVLGLGKSSKRSGQISIFGLVALAVIIMVNIYNDTPTAKSYGTAVDERIEKLCSLRDNGQTGTVTVAPLPVPYTEDVKHFLMTHLGKDTPKTVLYYISETDTIPNEYEFHVKQVLSLNFDFVLAKEAHNNN